MIMLFRQETFTLTTPTSNQDERSTEADIRTRQHLEVLFTGGSHGSMGGCGLDCRLFRDRSTRFCRLQRMELFRIDADW
jgi:hypothetical protein